MTYVAMYRMTDVDNFFIVPGCSSEKLTITETKKSKKLQARLAEDVRLMELARTTQTLYGKNEWQKRGNIHAHGRSKIKNDGHYLGIVDG